LALGLLAAALFLIPFFLVSRFAGPELPNLAGATVGGALFILLYPRQSGRRQRYPAVASQRSSAAVAPTAPALGLTRALSAYVALVVLVLGSRLLPPLQAALSGVVWQVSFFGRFESQFQPLYQPGTLLFIALMIGAWAQRASLAQIYQSFGSTLRQVAPVTLALLTMLGLAKVMDHAGMVSHMANAAANGAGGSWAFIAPFIGMLGSFITGSATSSNILFTDLQQATAQALGLPTLVMLGAQGFGAGVGNMIALHNIIAGGATVGLGGQEDQVLRRVLPVCLGYTLLGGLCSLYFANS
jgi:lactate permease